MATEPATSPKLTAKQEKYSQLRAIHGLNETEAYLVAYGASKSRIPGLYVDASKLEHNPKICLRIAELTAEIRKATIERDIADIVERKVHATKKMRDVENSTRDQLAANRLLGEYEKDLGGGQALSVGGDLNIQLNVTNQLTLIMAEAEAHFPGILAWMETRMSSLGDGGK